MKMRKHAFHQYRFVNPPSTIFFFSPLFLKVSFFLPLRWWDLVFSFGVCCSSGETTLSASGMLVPHTLCDSQVAKRLYGGDNYEDRVLVVTVASVVEPFLSPQRRENIPQVGVVLIGFFNQSS